MKYPPNVRSIAAACLGAILGGTITLCLLLKVGDYALKVLIVSVLVSSSLGAILSIAVSDVSRLQPSRLSFLGIVISSIPLSLVLLFPVVAFHSLLFEIPMPMADVKPSSLRRAIGSPILLAFFFARVGWPFPRVVVCVGVAAACIAFLISRRYAFCLMLAITAHALFFFWQFLWAPNWIRLVN